MKTRILIVDDEADIREQVYIALRDEDYELAEAADLASLRRLLAGPAPDVLILDLKFPDGIGLTVLPEVKQKWPATKVILLTGFGTVEVAEEAFELDPHLFLQNKPFDPGTLCALVELALSARAVGSEA
jgi:two-component system, NtrC family, nitrogen regulation response regulator GlnG